jgi:hypothetical protein
MDLKQATTIQQALLAFCQTRTWINPQAVTLTLRLARWQDGLRTSLTPSDAQQNLRHFLNVLHKKLGSCGFTKHSVLQRLPIFEGTATVRPHYHMILDRPACIDAPRYAELILQEWPRTYWGYKLVTVEPCTSADGWLDYITKLRSKADYADAIDWKNFK